MKKYLSKNILFIISIVSLVLLLIPISIFLYYFGSNNVSNDLSAWALFGDFIGGTLNTVISLISLVILGLLTHNIGKQSNEENKNVTLLIKRIESYEKLSEFLPTITKTVIEIEYIVKEFAAERYDPSKVEDSHIKDLELSTRSFTNLYCFLEAFRPRFGHLYNYNFNSEDYTNLIEDSYSLKCWFDQLVKEIKKRDKEPTGESDGKLFDRFVGGFNKLLENLQKELK